MQNAVFRFKKTATLLALTASLTACGSGFQAPGVLQTQSGTADIDKPAPGDSLQQIQHNKDATTQKTDPILGSANNRNTSYKLPENTFETIRVRLLPIAISQKSEADDTFQNSQGVDTVSLANENGLVIKDLASGVRPLLERGTVVTIVFSKKELTIDGKTYVLDSLSQIGIFPRLSRSLTQVSLKLNEARLQAAKIAVAKEGELPFRGIFLLRNVTRVASGRTPASGAWNLVNYVELEDYVRAVVPSEIGASSATEALKAQALASRTFAVHAMVIARCAGHSSVRCAPRVWDVDPSTNSQAYIGGLAENQSTFVAIDSTKDQIIGYRGAPALSMFSASSGGETVSIGQYACLSKGLVGKAEATCEARYNVEDPYLQDKKDPFNGGNKRFGHGVGMPQESAKAMAKAGRPVSEIIAQYYTGSSIEKIDFQ